MQPLCSRGDVKLISVQSKSHLMFTVSSEVFALGTNMNVNPKHFSQADKVKFDEIFIIIRLINI